MKHALGILAVSVSLTVSLIVHSGNVLAEGDNAIFAQLPDAPEGIAVDTPGRDEVDATRRIALRALEARREVRVPTNLYAAIESAVLQRINISDHAISHLDDVPGRGEQAISVAKVQFRIFSLGPKPTI